MPKKNNIRSIRFSDELAELIDHQQGDTFTQKFENLITRCVWELPAKEEQLRQLDQQIQEKKILLNKITAQIKALRMTINDLLPKIKTLETSINQEIKNWDT